MKANKYRPDVLDRWIKRMRQAGWGLSIFHYGYEYMWSHEDEDVKLTIDESRDLYWQYANTGEEYIPDPYDIMRERGHLE